MCISSQENPEQGNTEDVRDARSIIDGEKAGVEWKAGLALRSGTYSCSYHRRKDKLREVQKLTVNDGLS